MEDSKTEISVKRYYQIRCPVESAEGHQLIEVAAHSEEEALKLFEDEGGMPLSEEVEVTKLGAPGREHARHSRTGLGRCGCEHESPPRLTRTRERGGMLH